MHILIDSSLPNIEQAFPAPFMITAYHSNDDVKHLLSHQEALVCRSTLKVDANLLRNNCLKYVLTASSGIDHIDKAYLKLQNIQLIDAKGSNAISVADYVLASLACLSDEGINIGKKAGIIGLGAVGTEVFHYLQLLGYDILTYDPLREMRDKTFKSCHLEALFDCDLLCIHAELQDNLHYPSRNLINVDFLKHLQPQTILINAARGGIVNELDLLNSPIKPLYCTDVYLNEPHVNPEIIQYAKLCTPHIAGHSLEAKTAAVLDLSKKLHQILHLPLAEIVKFTQPSLRKIDNLWPRRILSWYDPRIETQVLKEIARDSNLFLNLRKKHNCRHDFGIYITK